MRREAIVHNILYGTLLAVNLALIFFYTANSENKQEVVDIHPPIVIEIGQNISVADTCFSWHKPDVNSCPTLR